METLMLVLGYLSAGYVLGYVTRRWDWGHVVLIGLLALALVMVSKEIGAGDPFDFDPIPFFGSMVGAQIGQWFGSKHRERAEHPLLAVPSDR